MTELFIGVMSGTSLDGLDLALSRCQANACEVVATKSIPLPTALRDTLMELSVTEAVAPETIGFTDAAFGDFTGNCINAFLAELEVPSTAIRAIGSHGQTIRHRPPRPDTDQPGFSWQIGDPNRIAEITGITTVADFRRRDVAAGGQGAPLAPAFHRAVFGSAEHARAVLNIGGFANISLLPPNTGCTGFDTGPGNALMDAWYALHQAGRFDVDGAWASGAEAIPALLDAMMGHAFFSLPPPKSTGREDFGLNWLRSLIAQTAPDSSPQSVQATLLELTALTVTSAVKRYGKDCRSLYVCGGGAHNRQLMHRLKTLLAPVRVDTTTALGIDPDWVEAAAFAWLACRTLEGLSGNLTDVTGAKRNVILGAIHPG